jgi:hypothetical protein
LKLNRRVLVATLAGLVVACVAVATRGGSTVIAPKEVLHKIDLVANVNTINVDTAWSQSGSITSGGAMRLTLDDLRVLTISEGTMVDNYADVAACSDFATPHACVLLADMLGDAVVWFALVSADATSGQEFLTLPGLVDMQNNGDEGILRNNWVVKLATPVKRNCGDTDTSSLRDFITRFPDKASTSTMNLTTDNIVSVTCAQ